jgi:hypothetical protein
LLLRLPKKLLQKHDVLLLAQLPWQGVRKHRQCKEPLLQPCWLQE